ncbi:MAG: SBBP repeat-containing protein [Bacteroidota bacterium]|nr:SBBP repeat-containing protein [Bacteroidota bacterium]
MGNRITFLLFGLTIFSTELFSQPSEEWVNRYNGPGNSFDIVSKSILDNENNIYVYGSSVGSGTGPDFAVLKYSQDGEIVWLQRYNGAGNRTDQINSACQDNTGNSYITGFTTDSNNVINLTALKYDSSGNLIWVRIFRDALFSGSYGQDIALDSSGNVLICGSSRYVISGRYAMTYIVYSNAGDMLGSFVINKNSIGDDLSVKIKVDNFNNVIIAGTVTSATNNKDIFLIKFASMFSILWSKTINGTANSDDDISDIALDNSNNIYLCGSIRNISTSLDYYYSKLNPDGQFFWQGSYNGKGNYIDITTSMSIDSINNTYITGYIHNDSSFGSEDILTIKLSHEGIKIWAAQFNGASNGIDLGNSVTTDRSGNVYVGGATERGNFQTIFALLKYNPEGILEWFQDYEGGSVSEDFVYNVILDKHNDIFVTGISIGEGTDYDFATIKYSQTIGINNITELTTDKFFLSQNYPNPFNPATTINYTIAKDGIVKLKLYDMIGKEVVTLIDEFKARGNYQIVFDFKDHSNFSSGVYYYKIESNTFSDVKKMIFIK